MTILHFNTTILSYNYNDENIGDRNKEKIGDNKKWMAVKMNVI
jgi:hypothetical protein